jgi:hypothetical protein
MEITVGKLALRKRKVLRDFNAPGQILWSCVVEIAMTLTERIVLVLGGAATCAVSSMKQC